MLEAVEPPDRWPGRICCKMPVQRACLLFDTAEMDCGTQDQNQASGDGQWP